MENENNVNVENEYKLPEIKAMTYGQIKEMRKKNLDPVTAEIAPNNTKLVDYILETIYSDFESEKVPYYRLVKLAMDTYNMTYGGPDAIKN